MPPVVRAVGYYITFFGGVALTSITGGLYAAGIGVDQYPLWLTIWLGAWPAWTAAFGLTAGSHVPIKEEVLTPRERHPGYVPDRVLVEDDSGEDEEIEDLDIAGTRNFYDPGYTGQERIVRDDRECVCPDKPERFGGDHMAVCPLSRPRLASSVDGPDTLRPGEIETLK